MAHVGSIIGGRFKVIDCIGKGGMGVVWLASDRNLGKYWAIKEIKIDEGESNRQKKIRIERLYSEADMMKKLDHPAMPRIVDLITEASTLYVVMDYINGSSLDKELKRNGAAFDQELVISWAIQLCSVLGYLHSQNPPVIYRDMKPSNVMLCSDGTVRLIDFGIAREYKPGRNHDTQVLGTPQYAAPEQLCEDEQSDARSDIYSLGMTMYRLVTAVKTKELAALKPLREIDPKLSQGLENIIIKCTQRDPDRRYQSADQLRYDLEHYTELTDEHVALQKKKVNRFWGAVGSAAACLILGVGLFLGSNVVSAGQSSNFVTSAQNNVKAALSAESAGNSSAADSAWQSVLTDYQSAKANDERTALESLESAVIAPWKDGLTQSGTQSSQSQAEFSHITSLLRSMAPSNAANNGIYAKACFDVAQAWYWHAPETVTERRRAQAVYEWYAKAAQYGIENITDFYKDDQLNLEGFDAGKMVLASSGLNKDEAKASLVFSALTSYYAVSDEGVNNIYKKYWHNLNEVINHLDDLAFESNTVKALSCSLVYNAIRDTDVLRTLKGAILEEAGGDASVAQQLVTNLLQEVQTIMQPLQNDGSVDDYVKKMIALEGAGQSQAEQSIQAVFSTVYSNNEVGKGV